MQLEYFHLIDRIANLDIGAELTYQRLNAKLTGQANTTVFASCTPGGPGFGGAACNALGPIKASSDAFEARLRVQRQF